MNIFIEFPRRQSIEFGKENPRTKPWVIAVNFDYYFFFNQFDMLKKSRKVLKKFQNQLLKFLIHVGDKNLSSFFPAENWIVSRGLNGFLMIMNRSIISNIELEKNDKRIFRPLEIVREILIDLLGNFFRLL